MLVKVGPNLGAAAHVIEGRAARSVFVRMIITSMTVLKGAPQPTEIFKTADDGAKWIRQTIDIPSHINIPAALEKIRQAIST